MDVGKSIFFCWIEQKRNGAMEDCLWSQFSELAQS